MGVQMTTQAKMLVTEMRMLRHGFIGIREHAVQQEVDQPDHGQREHGDQGQARSRHGHATGVPTGGCPRSSPQRSANRCHGFLLQRGREEIGRQRDQQADVVPIVQSASHQVSHDLRQRCLAKHVRSPVRKWIDLGRVEQVVERVDPNDDVARSGCNGMHRSARSFNPTLHEGSYS